ncbi:hypothetical protein JW992_08745 [candidate division KSB1 bacterium]|nr:hypothetical protein [candidate division KSB1 bacterium]
MQVIRKSGAVLKSVPETFVQTAPMVDMKQNEPLVKRLRPDPDKLAQVQAAAIEQDHLPR